MAAMKFLRSAPIFFCTLLASCKARPTWSADLLSPDGTHIAKAQAYASGGFGSGDGGQTRVDLNWTSGSQGAMNVLILPGGPQAAGEQSNLRMKWIDDTHLQLEYTGKEEPIFQAIRCANVNVSLVRY